MGRSQDDQPNIQRASKPFRIVMGWILRKTACDRCQGQLEIVWIETPEEGSRLTFFDRGIQFTWQSGSYAVSAGYECSQCGRVTKWNGRLVRERRDTEERVAARTAQKETECDPRV